MLFDAFRKHFFIFSGVSIFIPTWFRLQLVFLLLVNFYISIFNRPWHYSHSFIFKFLQLFIKNNWTLSVNFGLLNRTHNDCFIRVKLRQFLIFRYDLNTFINFGKTDILHFHCILWFLETPIQQNLNVFRNGQQLWNFFIWFFQNPKFLIQGIFPDIPKDHHVCINTLIKCIWVKFSFHWLYVISDWFFDVHHVIIALFDGITPLDMWFLSIRWTGFLHDEHSESTWYFKSIIIFNGERS